MPMSPATTIFAPASISAGAVTIPASTAASASSRVNAGPVEMSPVPRRTLAETRPGTGDSGTATDTSTTVTVAPACRANALITAPPVTKLATICAVTSCGHGVTRWVCTPWSPAKIATAAGSGIGGGQVPASPARRTDSSSSSPSEPAGLVSRACRSRAAAIAAPSSGRIAASTWSSKGGLQDGEERVTRGSVPHRDPQPVRTQPRERVTAPHGEAAGPQPVAYGLAVGYVDQDEAAGRGTRDGHSELVQASDQVVAAPGQLPRDLLLGRDRVGGRAGERGGQRRTRHGP